MKCLVCKREVDTLRSAVKNGEVISERCDRCLDSVKSLADGARQYERNWQRRHYAKDIIQPFEKEKYIKAYPEQARKHGYSEEDLRKFG